MLRENVAMSLGSRQSTPISPRSPDVEAGSKGSATAMKFSLPSKPSLMNPTTYHEESDDYYQDYEVRQESL
jgi:hypothetical protein